MDVLLGGGDSGGDGISIYYKLIFTLIQWNPSIRTPQFSEHPLFPNTILLARWASLASLHIDSKLCFPNTS